MSRTSRVLVFLLASFATIGLIGAGFDVAAKDKKDEKKDKKDPKKEEKIEKKEPFKTDTPQQEFKPDEKEKSSWVYAVAFGGDGKNYIATTRAR